MKLNDYHILNPLIREKELGLLSDETFEKMLQANNLTELANLLKTTEYGALVEHGLDNGFNQALSQQQKEMFEWLVNIAPDKDVVWIYTMRFTFHNLKILTKAEELQENFDQLFIPDGFFTIEELKSAWRNKQSSVLPQILLAAIQEVTDYLASSNELAGIDIIYDRYFFLQQSQLGKKIGHPVLMAEIEAFIDWSNIILLLRGIRQGRSQNFMKTVLSDGGSLPREELLTFVEQEEELFKQYLLQNFSDEGLTQLLQAETLEIAKIERIKDNALTKFFESAQVEAFGPLPLLAFLNAKEIEVKNLQLIVTGIKSGLPVTLIKERMRSVNVI